MTRKARHGKMGGGNRAFQANETYLQRLNSRSNFDVRGIEAQCGWNSSAMRRVIEMRSVN